MARVLVSLVGGHYPKMSAKVGISEVAQDAESSGQEAAYRDQIIQVQSWEGCLVRCQETDSLHEWPGLSRRRRKRQESHH